MPAIGQRAGELRRRIVVQSKTDAQDTFGEADPTWGTLATVWADIEPMGGREMMGSGLEMDETPHQFTFRYGSTLSGLNVRDHRITWNSKTFDLVSVNNVEQRNVTYVCVGVVRG